MSIATLNSLEKEMNKKILADKEHSQNDGDGTLHSIRLVKGILEDLTMYQNYQLGNVLPFYPLKKTKTKQKTTYSKAK